MVTEISFPMSFNGKLGQRTFIFMQKLIILPNESIGFRYQRYDWMKVSKSENIGKILKKNVLYGVIYNRRLPDKRDIKEVALLDFPTTEVRRMAYSW